MKRLAVFCAVLALLTFTGCSGAATGTEFQAIRYSGGSFDIEKFKQCHPQSVREYGEVGDHIYYYPANQRTYSFTDDANASPETGPIAVTTKDSQQVAVRGFITFQLTQDCKLLQQFHERIGKRYGADFESTEDQDGQSGDQDAGWNRFLADYFTVPVNTIMDAAGLESTWRELYTNKEKQAAFETTVKNRLAAEIGIQAGPGVIEVLNISIQRPEPDQGLIESLKKVEQGRADAEATRARADADKVAQASKNALAVEQYKEVAECVKVLGRDACFRLKLQQGPNPPQYIPDGSNLLVDNK